MVNGIYTIGHSTHRMPTFLDLLERNGVSAIADVRSVPFSRRQPHFSRGAIEDALASRGIKYVHLGVLGARTNRMDCYVNGRVQYHRIARTPEFQMGIRRLLAGSEREQIGVMCAEADPLYCHRTVLVARVLDQHGADIEHIHADGRREVHASVVRRIAGLYRLDRADLFHDDAALMDEALRRHEQRIAYVLPEAIVDDDHHH